MAPSYVYEPQSEGPPNKKTAQPQWQNGFVRAQLRLPGVAVAFQACPSCGEKQAVCVEVVGVTGRGGVSRGRLAPHLPGS